MLPVARVIQVSYSRPEVLFCVVNATVDPFPAFSSLAYTWPCKWLDMKQTIHPSERLRTLDEVAAPAESEHPRSTSTQRSRPALQIITPEQPASNRDP